MRAKSPQQQGRFNTGSGEARKKKKKRFGHAMKKCHMLNKSSAHKHFVAWGWLRRDLSGSLHARMLKCTHHFQHI